jgi:hypothetical protein
MLATFNEIPHIVRHTVMETGLGEHKHPDHTLECPRNSITWDFPRHDRPVPARDWKGMTFHSCLRQFPLRPCFESVLLALQSWTTDGMCREPSPREGIVCCRGASSSTLPSTPYVSVQKQSLSPEHQPSRESTQHQETMWVLRKPQKGSFLTSA